ncbi:MAG: hypothetical protein KMY53_01000 [Desulfarculus sp.]|nr:hypothetical protein [Pseudomonadota bacterium]MBV1715216.1 hypothetical protein [Desulfarculus sp.]MBU4575594.1 hypothetical protein [Pseudomonadota bacterium]MBU4598237.1 hypothetical protein [Pseudomonadota bacterium]MBV1736714.1 hypothetical protein [Desulfarculus sp.]
MRLTISAVLFALILALAGAAQAHRISVYAYVEDGQIKGEGYMPGGGKVSNQQVQVLDAGGKVLAEAKTSPEGAFSLPLPQAKPPLTLVLSAGAGHRATYKLSAADLGVAATAAKAAPASAAPTAAKPVAQAVAAGQDLGPQIKKAVEQAVAPLRAQLAEMALRSNEVSLKDIVGGLGWIVGLLGLAAYMKARKMAGAPK